MDVHPHAQGLARRRPSAGAAALARIVLQAGALLLAAWILVSDVRSGLGPLGAALGAAVIVISAAAMVWQPAWLAVATLFLASAVVPWDTSPSAFVMMLVAVFDTGSRRPAWRGLTVLGLGVLGLVLDWVVGIQDIAATVAFSFVLIAVATVGSLLRAQAERVAAVNEVATLRRQVERTELARDMHDIVAAPMSHVVLLATDLLARDEVPPGVRASLEVVQAEARESLEELRAMLTCLRSDVPLASVSPSSPDAVGREWLASLARLASRGFTPEAHYEFSLTGDQAERAEVLRLAIRELTTNVLRHSAPPGKVRMTLVATPAQSSVVVANPLTGPPHGQLPASGMGLRGLRERAEACGGQLLVTTMDDEWLAVLNLDSPVPA